MRYIKGQQNIPWKVKAIRLEGYLSKSFQSVYHHMNNCSYTSHESSLGELIDDNCVTHFWVPFNASYFLSAVLLVGVAWLCFFTALSSLWTCWKSSFSLKRFRPTVYCKCSGHLTEKRNGTIHDPKCLVFSGLDYIRVNIKFNSAKLCLLMPT